MFWLVCKNICKQIDHIEASGTIKEWEQKVANDVTLQKALRINHLKYAILRDNNLNADDRAKLNELGISHDFSFKGIGGVADFQRIRCLHMHYASHQVIPNWVGRKLDEMNICCKAQLVDR